MANRKFLIESILGLAQKLGANPNKFMGTKSNINFLGTGDKGMKGTTFSGLLRDDFMTVGSRNFTKDDMIRIIEQDSGYVTAGKLNDVQLNTMYNNLLKIDETYNPPPGPLNVIDLETGTRNINKEGLESLRETDKIKRFTEGKGTSKTAMSDKIKEGIETLKTKFRGSDAAKAEDDFIRKGAADFGDSVAAEGGRRAVVRQVMKNNANYFGLTPEMAESIAKSKDLGKGGSNFPDPLIVFRDKGLFTRQELEQIDAIIEANPFDDVKNIADKVSDYLQSIRPDGFAEGGRIGYRSGRSVKGIMDLMEGKFTKAEFVIERMKNSIKGALGKTDDESKYVQETFPNMIKELEAKPELGNNPNVWKMFSEDLPKNQRVVVHSDDSVSFFRQSNFGPQNIKSTMKFAKENNISVKEASRILKMEPEDRILEITRLKAIRQMKKGGLARILEM